MSLLAFAVFLRPDAAHKVGQLNPVGYSRYGIAAAIVMFVAILISTAGTQRFIPLLRKPPARRLSLRQYAREMLATLNNRAFLILLLAAVFFNFATGLVFALALYVNTFFWKLSNAQISFLTLSTFIAVLLGFAVALPLSRRFGKKWSATAMFAFGISVNSTPLVLGLLGVLQPKASSGLVYLLFGFQAIGAAFAIGSSIMIVSMIADIVEESEVRTGRRSEGLFFAGGSFVQKAASGLGLFGSGLVLWVAHFPTDRLPGTIDPHVVRNFCMIYLWTTVALYAVAFWIISYFPIDRASHEETLRRLAAEAGPNLADHPPAPMV
jgi:Na+/melibiose symporter-like transporter